MIAPCKQCKELTCCVPHNKPHFILAKQFIMLFIFTKICNNASSVKRGNELHRSMFLHLRTRASTSISNLCGEEVAPHCRRRAVCIFQPCRTTFSDRVHWFAQLKFNVPLFNSLLIHFSVVLNINSINCFCPTCI